MLLPTKQLMFGFSLAITDIVRDGTLDIYIANLNGDALIIVDNQLYRKIKWIFRVFFKNMSNPCKYITHRRFSCYSFTWTVLNFPFSQNQLPSALLNVY